MVINLPGGIAATIVQGTDTKGRVTMVMRANDQSFRLVAAGGGYWNVYGDGGHRLYSNVQLPV